MRQIAIGWFLIGLLALAGCEEDAGGSDPSCGPGTHAENGQCVPDESSADTTTPSIGYMYFSADEVYVTTATTDKAAYQCVPPRYLDTGSSTSPGLFSGGCPGPLPLIGSYGPGGLYRWPDYIVNGADKGTPVGFATNIMSLSNGIAMIQWDTNNLASGLNGTYTIEMLTGWGSYDDKVIPYDYGWVNGAIMNMLGAFQAPFIHIYYVEITGTNDDGSEDAFIYFWELLLDEDTIDDAELLYAQLKEHIDQHWGVVSGEIFPDYTSGGLPEPLASVIDNVYFMRLPRNTAMASVPSSYWTNNVTYPGNNITTK
jgi:hypothetical protein